MADPYQPVRPGSALEISARTFNGQSQAGKDFSRRKLSENQLPSSPSATIHTRIYNGLTAALEAFAVIQTSISELAIGAAGVPLEAAAAPVLNAETPAADGRPFFVTREPIPVGGIGDVVTTGPALVRVNVTSSAHTFAAVTAGVTSHLTSSATEGVPILWKESGTGLKTALVQLGTAGADPDASLTARGYVNTGTQAFNGAKTFRQGIALGDGTVGSVTTIGFNEYPAGGSTAMTASDAGFAFFPGSVSGRLTLYSSRASGGAFVFNDGGTDYVGQTTNVTLSGGTILTFTGGILTGSTAPVAPVANWTSDSSPATTYPRPHTVNFTDLSTNSPTSWAWDFGDGTSSTMQNPTKTYNAAGVYTVTLTVANAAGSDHLTVTNYVSVS